MLILLTLTSTIVCDWLFHLSPSLKIIWFQKFSAKMRYTSEQQLICPQWLYHVKDKTVCFTDGLKFSDSFWPYAVSQVSMLKSKTIDQTWAVWTNTRTSLTIFLFCALRSSNFSSETNICRKFNTNETLKT